MSLPRAETSAAVTIFKALIQTAVVPSVPSGTFLEHVQLLTICRQTRGTANCEFYLLWPDSHFATITITGIRTTARTH
jgi:hypothetical protein